MKVNLSARRDQFQHDRDTIGAVKTVSWIANGPVLVPSTGNEWDVWWPVGFVDPVTDDLFLYYICTQPDGTMLRNEFLPTPDDYYAEWCNES